MSRNLLIPIVVLVFIVPMIFPQGSAYRTISCCGDGQYHDDFKDATDDSYSNLNNHYKLTTSGMAISQGHFKDKDIDASEFILAVWGYKQSQIMVHSGHGDKPDSLNTIINLDGDDIIMGKDFIDGFYTTIGTDDTVSVLEAGNWKQGGIPGTLFYFTTCYSGEDQRRSICKGAIEGGARCAVGHIGVGNAYFGKYLTKFTAKALADLGGSYNIVEVKNKALSDAKEESWSGYHKKWTGKYNDKCKTHIPARERDFDLAPFTLPNGIPSNPVGGTNTYTRGNPYYRDEGAMLFLNTQLASDMAVKVEYQSDQGGNWVNYGTFDLKKDTHHFAAGGDSKLEEKQYCQSQDIVVKFGTGVVHKAYFKVRITPVGDSMIVYNLRVQIFAEKTAHADLAVE